MLSLEQGLTLAVALLTLLGVSFGRLPKLPLGRAGLALAGASFLVLLGVQDVPSAWRLIDGDIMVLLLGLMIVNAVLTRAGFFRLLTRLAVRGARSTFALLVSLVFASGVLSAFFLNDTVVLMLTPLVLAVARTLERRPLPYLLALAMSANIGSVASLTGNPQNLIVGLRGGIGFLSFLSALAPVALLGLLALVGLLVLGFPAEFYRVRLSPPTLEPFQVDRGLLARSVLVALGMLTAFALGAPVPAAALVAAALMLMVAPIPSGKLLAELDWNLLVLFAGLFVVVGSLETSGLSGVLFGALEPFLAAGVFALSLLSALLSNLLSNVPAVLLLSPVLEARGGVRLEWLTVAMASTLAGNLTLLGSVANLIVVETARREGLHVGFFAYLRLGAPVTLATLLIGVLWLGYGLGG